MRRPEFQPCVPSIPVPTGEGRKCQPPQESLLWGDFPIYFINARRPDTGKDKHSRLQCLSSGQLLGPTARARLSFRNTRQISVQFQMERHAQLKTVTITHQCQSTGRNPSRQLLDSHHEYPCRGKLRVLGPQP